MMHRTGRYKTLNLVFGILPFIASLLIARLKPDSAAITQWLSIVRSSSSSPGRGDGLILLRRSRLDLGTRSFSRRP